MRNWNRDLKGISNNRFERLSRTYEELKLDNFLDNMTFEKGLSRTYEELKHLFKASLTEVIILFIAYLWGIETQETSVHIVMYKEFIAYLWGIETFFLFIKIIFKINKK